MRTKLIFLLLLISNIFYPQKNLEQNFRNDLNAIVEDAAKGFTLSKGQYSYTGS